MDRKIILVFLSIHHLLTAEKILQKAAVPFEMMPLPLELSSSCGMCLSVPTHEKRFFSEFFKGKIHSFRIFMKDNSNYIEL